MKKLITAGSGILIIALIIYISSLSSSHAMEESDSNDSERYEYEYYYNDVDDTEGGNMSHKTSTIAASATPDSRTAKQSEDKVTALPDSIDTDESSITVFVNKEYSLPASYIPKDLVVPDIKFYGTVYDEKRNMRSEAAQALEEMFRAADAENVILYGVSGYRSYSRQSEIYNKNIRLRGSAATNKVSALPGHSEHQTGLAIDISCKQLGGALSERFAKTAEGKWVDTNCYKFGFIIRYPQDKENLTGYSYEPWHIRYIGKDVAAYIYEHGITLEEYYSYKPSKDLSEDIISDAATAEKVTVTHSHKSSSRRDGSGTNAVSNKRTDNSSSGTSDKRTKHKKASDIEDESSDYDIDAADSIDSYSTDDDSDSYEDSTDDTDIPAADHSAPSEQAVEPDNPQADTASEPVTPGIDQPDEE